MKLKATHSHGAKTIRTKDGTHHTFLPGDVRDMDGVDVGSVDWIKPLTDDEDNEDRARDDESGEASGSKQVSGDDYTVDELKTLIDEEDLSVTKSQRKASLVDSINQALQED